MYVTTTSLVKFSDSFRHESLIQTVKCSLFKENNLPPSFHNIYIISIEKFLQEKVLIFIMHWWMPMWNYFEMFIVFCGVTARTRNIISLDLHNLVI